LKTVLASREFNGCSNTQNVPALIHGFDHCRKSQCLDESWNHNTAICFVLFSQDVCMVLGFPLQVNAWSFYFSSGIALGTSNLKIV